MVSKGSRHCVYLYVQTHCMASVPYQVATHVSVLSSNWVSVTSIAVTEGQGCAVQHLCSAPTLPQVDISPCKLRSSVVQLSSRSGM